MEVPSSCFDVGCWCSATFEWQPPLGRQAGTGALAARARCQRIYWPVLGKMCFMRTLREILSDVKRQAIEYYGATGKRLGVSGEVGEFEAAEKLGLELESARTEGYDATGTSADHRLRLNRSKVAGSTPSAAASLTTLSSVGLRSPRSIPPM